MFTRKLFRWLLFFVASFLLLASAFKWKQFLGNEHKTYSKGDIVDQVFFGLTDETIPLLPKKQFQTTIEDAYVITLGDSFFESTLDSYQFADELAQNSEYTTHHIPVDNLLREVNFNPMKYLEIIWYEWYKNKIMIVQSVERYADDIATYYDEHKIGPQSDIWKESAKQVFKKRSSTPLINEQRIRYFRDKNNVFWKINQRKARLLYTLLWEHKSSLEAYDDVTWMMFHHEQFDDYKKTTTPDQFLDLAKKIKSQQDALLETHNISMIYMIIPNKATIYPEAAWISPPDFIPKLESQLEAIWVSYISAYTTLLQEKSQESSPSLYFLNDTHYTKKGKLLLVDQVLE